MWKMLNVDIKSPSHFTKLDQNIRASLFFPIIVFNTQMCVDDYIRMMISLAACRSGSFHFLPQQAENRTEYVWLCDTTLGFECCLLYTYFVFISTFIFARNRLIRSCKWPPFAIHNRIPVVFGSVFYHLFIRSLIIFFSLGLNFSF